MGRLKAEIKFPAHTIKSKRELIVKSQLQLQANFGTFKAFAHWITPHFRCFPVLGELAGTRE